MFEISESLLRQLYYQEKLTQAEIAARFHCSTSTISNRMQVYRLQARSPADYRRLAISRDELYELYVIQRLTLDVIASRLGCNAATLSKKLKAFGMLARETSPARQHVPPEVYAHWTAELAYAVGLLVSDGNLIRGDYQIKLSSTDIEIVNLFSGCLHLDSKIAPCMQPRKDSLKPIYVLYLSDRSFRAFLERIGLTPAKSLTIGALDIPDSVFVDFLRGCWDGDGSFYIHRKRKAGQQYEYLYASLTSGSVIFLKWVQFRVEQLRGLRGSLYDMQLIYRNKTAEDLGRWLYYAPGVPALSRKRQIWQQFAV